MLIHKKHLPIFEPVATRIEPINGSLYFVEGNKYCKNIYNLMVDQIELVKHIAAHDIALIRLLPNPSDLVKLEAIKCNPSAIKLFHKPTIDMQLTAVRAEPFTIQMIRNPCEEVQLAAVNRRGKAKR